MQDDDLSQFQIKQLKDLAFGGSRAGRFPYSYLVIFGDPQGEGKEAHQPGRALLILYWNEGDYLSPLVAYKFIWNS